MKHGTAHDLAALVPPFLAFSADVTAFPLFDLKGTGLTEEFLSTTLTIVGEDTVRALLTAYEKAVDGKTSTSEREHSLRRAIFGDSKLGPIARNIVKLWYVGIWYQLPDEWSQVYGPKPGDVTHTVSANAYVEGLLWPAIGAHPPGAKAPGYASWVGPPEIPVKSLPVLRREDATVPEAAEGSRGGRADS